MSAAQEQQFKTYFKELVRVNEHVNLTRITAEDEVYLKHFYDSVTPLLLLPEAFAQGASLVDVGAGAGFPSLPIKILRPDLKVTIVDSLGKRLNFLADLLEKLDISGVNLVHGRAEDVGQNPEYREKFDIVTARAVARMSVLCEYCLPLAKTGGKFLALKGPRADDELDAARNALAKLGGEAAFSRVFTLPGSDEERTIILVDKVKETPGKYPRQAGTPSRKPL
ncbi:ribosomal RNA small subunit methyltransferase G [Lactobacillus nasalidis]|uniref:Ribosomal RNA small subunit methyltransferase G n=1 Tax=Lactobacillus nasalidis TaxID=2797258 RepID=A0ABQ3W6H7_9LACO|nr:ribosomal RNA small subunit methyltransferase G [Lactobacillus nasalidis]